MVRRTVSRLPLSLTPRGLSRGQAAEYIGVGVTKFDEMVDDGRMPRPKRIDGRLVWDRVCQGGCVKKTRERHAVREMEVDPSKPLCRRRLQTAMSCFGQKPRW